MNTLTPGIARRLSESGTLQGALLALAAGSGAVAGSFAAVGRTPAFVASPVTGVVVDATPGIVVRFSILLLGELGDSIALGLGLAATVATFALVVGAARVAARRRGFRTAGVVLGGGAAVVLGLALVRDPVSAVGAGVGAALPLVVGEAARRTGQTVGEVPAGRREALGSIATAVGLGLAGTVIGSRLSLGTDAGTTTDQQYDASSETGRLFSMARERSLDVDGLEALVSEEFYEVDINQINPSPNVGDWTLAVTGAVESERRYSFDDIEGMEAVHRFNTLRCVGENLNGRKMDNALWTGVPLAALVDAANPQGEYVMLRAADGFYEEFPIAALEGGLLAYGMNGGALPRGHGAPARALVPGHWGEINVKWLTEIEVLDEEATGYWEERGWHGTGPVNTVAKLHAVNHRDDGIEGGGHAYAGTRGIRTGEVSVDGGATWHDAELSEPLPGDDICRQWVYRYEPPAGSHEVVVRAVDGTGTRQPKERSNAFPSGPTGWVSKTIRP